MIILKSYQRLRQINIFLQVILYLLIVDLMNQTINLIIVEVKTISRPKRTCHKNNQL